MSLAAITHPVQELFHLCNRPGRPGAPLAKRWLFSASHRLSGQPEVLREILGPFLPLRMFHLRVSV